MSNPQVEIEAVCVKHPPSGRLVVRREPGRIVLDGCRDGCCAIAVLDQHAVTLLDVLGEWFG